MKQHPNSWVLLPYVQYFKAALYPDSISRFSRLVLNLAHMYG